MKKIYCVKDVLANLCSDPFIAVNYDVAKRTYLVWSGQHKDLAKDSILLELGDYNEETGELIWNPDGVVTKFTDCMKELGIE